MLVMYVLSDEDESDVERGREVEGAWGLGAVASAASSPTAIKGTNLITALGI
jgi:hypothetical protein